MKTTTYRPVCQSCQPARINGVLCHEHGCPDAGRDEVRECRFCGCEFKPENRFQKCCSEECNEDLSF